LPGRTKFGGGGERGEARIRHAQRADMPGLDLACHKKARGACGHTARRFAFKGGAMQASRHAFSHKAMIGRMKLDKISAIASGANDFEAGRISFWEAAQPQGLRRAEIFSEGGKLPRLMASPRPCDRLAQPKVSGKKVEVFEWRRLIERSRFETA